ncbi:M20 family metallo-hydrolase [Virgibacillus ihumii]|uniref:M20 family metallo-hydrolase n=1 Tax=Virgibacillus ihumii TaxID=2686091 RepID=UPI00157DF8C1|nr:M20 family metallo-hydrolase [Virgibacillus ihumii]
MLNLQEWIEQKLCELNLVERMEDPHGYNRLGYTEEERKSHQQFIRIAKELGLNTYQDRVGNQWAIWNVHKTAPTIALGSHLDTVYNGGGYDGVAGVLSALAAVKILKDNQFTPKKNIAVVCFISEESARFGVSTIGSKAISGELMIEELEGVRDRDGITVKEAVEQMGVKWEDLTDATLPLSRLEQFVELHIEQGRKLQDCHADLGVVTGIARPTRLLVTASGIANHTGTTSMNNRNDALVAIAPLVQYVSELTKHINKQEDPHLVATVSTVDVKPNSMTSIPSKVEFGIDIRSVDDTAKQSLVTKIKQFCKEAEKKHQVKIEVETLVENKSVFLDDTIKSKLLETGHQLGFKTELMVSGAGHDVMNMATRWPSGLLFIPCRDGISHQPKEYTEISNLVNGTKVLTEYLQIEAKQ